MRNFFDFLGEAQTEYKDALDGKRSGGGFDGPPLPQDRQYRARISRGEWRQAQGSGNWSFAMTFEVLEPEEYAGRKFTEYYSIESGTSNIGKEKFATLLGASGITTEDYPERTGDAEKDNAAIAKLFEDTQYVIATRIWGDELDRTGLRYLNKDYGQVLQDKIEPPKPRGGNLPPKKGGALKADITIPKAEEPDTPNTEPDEPRPQTQFPGGKSPSGVTLPPGLRK